MTISTGSLATLIGAELVGAADIALLRIDSVDNASEGVLTFIREARFAPAWKAGRASAALVNKSIPLASLVDDGAPPTGRALLVVPDADLAMIQALQAFAEKPAPLTPGIHPSAVIEPGAEIDAGATVGPNCTVMVGATIGAGVHLVANVTVARGAKIGAGSVLHPGVCVLERCEVGQGCILHSGAVIGADGFGYHPRPDGRGLLKVPHIGNVVIGDDVEIGANACIDRGKFGATTVGDGTKIDNLVQIGHNCRIGRCCILCGEVGLSGSVVLGDGVVLGGRVGVADNVKIGAGAKVGAYSGVIHDLPGGETFLGVPAVPVKESIRIHAYLRSIGRGRGKEGT